jgi:TolB-like protein/tetratricopeptide (TPR) repeat protein
MATGPAPAPGPRVDTREVRAHLDKVLASSCFAGAPRVQQFLRFVVEETLEGRAAELKESVVAVQVFGRRSDFDSHSDSVVRVQATHLRKRLREYYQTEGLHDGMVIELPPGAYVPAFRSTAGLPAAAPGRRKRRWLPPAAGLVLAAAAIAFWLFGWAARNSPTSIAVLPFVSLDTVPESEYLGEGIAEDLMTSLARSPDLRVVARTSAFQFREKNISARSVGHDLGASVLLEGSIRGSPDHLKVDAQLVSAGSGFDLWSGSWEGPADAAPLFEEQIVGGVRQVLGKTRGGREPTAPETAVRPPLPGAQEAYWRGRYLLSKGHEARAGSIRFLEEAARADPQYAPAYAALATAYATMAFHMEGEIGELLAKARRSGARALELDADSAEALGSLAVLSYAFDHDWASAERGFERALALNPSYARGHLQYAMGLISRARFDAAIAHIRAARDLDPLSFAIGNDLAVALVCAGRYDASIASARQTLRNDPTFVFAHVALGDALAMKGDSTAAIAEFQQAIQKLGRGPWILGPMGYALARAGRKAEAENAAREIESDDGPGVQIAHVYAALDDKPRALDALEHAYAQRIVDLNFMAVDPMLATLRAEPRFLALKARLGL